MLYPRSNLGVLCGEGEERAKKLGKPAKDSEDLEGKVARNADELLIHQDAT